MDKYSLERYSKQTIAARYYLLGKGFYEALDAMEFGREIHTGLRKDGVTPEFQHQIQIFHYVRTLETSLMYPEETYVAVFLHDGPEDKQEVTHNLIAKRYNPLSTRAIFLLDKNGKTMQSYADELTKDAIGSIVKPADRDHNLGSMTGTFTKEKQISYVQETEKFYMPMLKNARRLFPRQENAYENIKHVINSKLDLLDVINGSTS